MQIHRVPRPTARDAAPHPLLEAFVHVDAAVARDLYDHDDFVDTVTSRTVLLFGSESSTYTAWVALPDGVDPESCHPGDGLATAGVRLWLKEDLHQAMVYVQTHPDHRSQGIAKALYAVATADLAAQGRTTWQTWSHCPGPEATGPDAIAARTGSGAVDGRSPNNRWLTSLGFTLEQCERPSMLVLDDDTLARAATLRAEASDIAGPDHELVTWVGNTPTDLLGDLGWLLTRMSTDVPSGELEFDEQVWDADRVRAQEDRARAAGMDSVITAVRHRPTGRLVAYTQFEWYASRPEGVFQENTIVLAEHRGHRLGQLVKAVNLAALRDANPAARRVHTWNAVENGWMLAINDALGFVPSGLEGAWQKKL